MRSSTTELFDIRSNSWLLAAKCLSEVPTPLLCTPLIKAAAIFPDKTGSSEKYSKLRPPSGERFILIPGPNKICTSLACDSVAKASPTRFTNSLFHDEAKPEAVGKQVAGTLFVKSKPSALRKPCGPSVIKIDGTPSLGIACVDQAVAPEHSEAFSSSVICATIFLAFSR